MTTFFTRLVIIISILCVSSVLCAANWDYLNWTNQITAIQPVDDIYWIGTNTGLIRLDSNSGTSTRFHMGNSTLPSNIVTCLAKGWDSSIWIGTEGGLARFDGVNWESWTAERLFLNRNYDHDVVSSMLVDHKGHLWVCLQEWEPYTYTPQIATTSIRTIELGRFGITSTTHASIHLVGLFQDLVMQASNNSEEGTYTDYQKAIAVTNGNEGCYMYLDLGYDLLTYAFSKNGELIIRADDNYSTEDEGEKLFIHRNVGLEMTESEIEELSHPGQIVQSISSDALGNVFAVIDGKAWQWTDGEWNLIPLPYESLAKPLMAGNTISPVMAGTTDGKMIIGNKDQLYVLSNDECTEYILNDTGITGIDKPHNMHIDGNDRLWMASSSELVSYDGESWQSIPYSFTYTGEHDVGITSNSQGEIWVNHSNEIYMVDNNSLILKKTIPGLIEIAFDGQNNLWALSNDKLMKMQGGAWQQIPGDRSNLISGVLLDLCMDLDGTVWVLSDDTIYSFDYSNWSSITHDATCDWPGDYLCVDSRGLVWLLNSGINMTGFYVWSGLGLHGGFGWQTVEDGMVSPPITADDKGAWWGWRASLRDNGVACYCRYNHGIMNGEISDIPDSPDSICRAVCIDSNNNKWFLLENQIAVYNEDGIDYPYSTTEAESTE